MRLPDAWSCEPQEPADGSPGHGTVLPRAAGAAASGSGDWDEIDTRGGALKGFNEGAVDAALRVLEQLAACPEVSCPAIAFKP